MDKHEEFPENFSLTAGDRIAADDFVPRDQPPPFYEGGQRRYVIDQAIHHLHFDTAAVLILGEEGSGKTILLDQLLNDLQESMDGCLLDVESIGPAGLLPELAAGLDLHEIVEFSCESVAHAAAQRSSALGLPLLVTLDNAEAMSVEQLDALFEVARLSHGSVRLLLCGDLSLQARADRAAQGEAVFALTLPPLSRAEVGEYLQFLARRRGQLGRLALPAEALQNIYLASHGNIALINQQADELFAAGSAISAFKWRDVTRMPALHLGLVVALVILLLVLRFTGNDARPEAAMAETTAADAPVAAPSAVATESAGAASSAALSSSQPAALVSKELSLPAPAAEPVVTPAPAVDSTAATALSASSTALAETTVATGDAASEQTNVQAAVETAPVEVATVKVETPAAAAPEPVAAAPVEPQAAPKPVAPKPAAKSVSANGRGERALLAMPSSAFVLQVFASHDKTKVARFVQSWQSKVKMSYFETRHNGKPWFVAVVAGPYKSSEKARAAATKLPAGLREQKPWPRQLASIQQDIRALN